MARTYLKSSSSMLTKKPPENDCKSKVVAAPVRGIQDSAMKTDWRGKPQWDDTLDSPEIVLKSKNIRKPLQPLKNMITPSLFTDVDSSPELSLRRSVQSKQAVAVDDTFDKLFDNVPEKTDHPFDKLFENVDKKPAQDPFDRLLTDLTPNPPPNNHSLYHSVFSTPNMSEEMSTDTSNQPGLFSSFSKQTETEMTPKLKRPKSNRNFRTKKQSAKDIVTVAKPREYILSETLEVKIVFEGDTINAPEKILPPYQTSSLSNLIPQSPTRGRPLSTLSVATSTPVLSSKSFERVLSSGSSPPGSTMMLSPVRYGRW